MYHAFALVLRSIKCELGVLGPHNYYCRIIMSKRITPCKCLRNILLMHSSIYWFPATFNWWTCFAKCMSVIFGIFKRHHLRPSEVDKTLPYRLRGIVPRITEHVAEEILNLLLCHYESMPTNDEQVKAARQVFTRFLFHDRTVKSPLDDENTQTLSKNKEED